MLIGGFLLTGTKAREALFQAYIMDGVARWNRDRQPEQLGQKSDLLSYDYLLRHRLNTLAQETDLPPFFPTDQLHQHTGKFFLLCEISCSFFFKSKRSFLLFFFTIQDKKCEL
jgi:hypothetical protein